jgi:hypothetical protein
MSTVLGVAMTGGNPTIAREKSDYYQTPPACTTGIMDIEAAHLKKHNVPVWECACGEGAMAKIIQGYGFTVISTDLIDRGYGAQMDFLETYTAPDAPKTAIITNPPFNLAPQFIEHALGTFKVPYLACYSNRRSGTLRGVCRCSSSIRLRSFIR